MLRSHDNLPLVVMKQEMKKAPYMVLAEKLSNDRLHERDSVIQQAF